MDKKLISDTIANMVATSEALDKFCDDPKNHNSYVATFLEQMSWDLHRHANDMKELQDLYGFQL